MTTTVASLISDVTFRVTPDGVLDTNASARILTKINWALVEIARQKQPAEFDASEDSTPVLTASVATYAKPANVLLLKGIKYVNGSQSRDLKPMTLQRYRTVDETFTGIPWAFLDFGTNVTVYPIPDATTAGGTLRFYFVAAPDEVLATDNSPLPHQWDEAIILGAAYKYLRDDNEFERAGAAWGEWTTVLRASRRREREAFVSAGGRAMGAGRNAFGTYSRGRG